MKQCAAFLIMALALGCGSEAADEAKTAGQPAPYTPETKEQAANDQEIGKADWSLDPCEWNGWYGDGECDWFCVKADVDCAVPTLFADPRGDGARHPILLAHGFDASPEESVVNRWSFWNVRGALEDDGHVVCEATVPPYDSVANRSEFLAAAVDDCLLENGADRVNIIAHSMGGLDSRHMISTRGYGPWVASLTTLSTAHRGTNVADFLLNLTPGLADPVLNALAGLWGRTFSDLSEHSNVRAALVGLSEARAPAFNAENPNDSRVYYQSWAGVSSFLGFAKANKVAQACDNKVFINSGTADKVHFTLKPLYPVAAKGFQGLINDGMITVASSKWGNFRGCIPADHMDEVGQYRNDGPNPHTGFDHLLWYRTMAFDLASRGY